AAQLAGLVPGPNQDYNFTQDNPGTNSPSGCGDSSDYQVRYLVQTPPRLKSFQGLDSQTICVLGSDRNLWLEHAPFGKVPPGRQQVDGNVQAFQALNTNSIYVLGTDDNLWLEHAPFGKVPPGRQQVDGNVLNFQALDAQNVLVLGVDRALWLEHAPFG